MNAKFLRVSVFIYLVTAGLHVINAFVVQRVWPNEAVNYFLWWNSQSRTWLIELLPYVGLGFFALSLIAAVGLLLRAVIARYGFVLSVAGLLLCGLLGAVLDQLPQINTPYEMFLDSVSRPSVHEAFSDFRNTEFSVRLTAR